MKKVTVEFKQKIYKPHTHTNKKHNQFKFDLKNFTTATGQDMQYFIALN